MATETLGIQVTTTGAKEAAKDIEGIGAAATKAQAQVDKGMGGATKAIKETGKAADGAAKSSKALTGALTTLIAAVSVGELIKASDAYTNIQNKLASVTDTAEETAAAYENLKRISLDTGTTIDGNAKIFQSLTSVAKQYNLSGKDVAKVTEGIAKTLRATGASGPGAAAAVFQLSQSLGSGALRGEEFNSVIEGAPGLLDVLAKQLNTTRGGLRALANDGKITTKNIADAFINNFDAINAAAANVPLTIGAAFTNLQTKFNDYIGKASQATGATSLFADAIGFVADNLNIIVPVLLAIGAAFAAVQFAALASEVGVLAVAFYDLAAALAAAAVANPLIALLSIVAVGIAVVIEKTIGWGTVFAYVSAALTIAAKAVGNAFIGIANAAIATYNGMLALGKVAGLIDESAQPLEKLEYNTLNVAAAMEEAKKQSGSLNSLLGNTATSAAGAGNGMSKAAGDANKLTSSLNSTTQAANQAASALAKVQSLSGAGGLSQGAGGSTFVATAGASFTGNATTSADAFGHFRNGGGFRVPGAGAADSKLVQFMASPGEHVSISTPAQQAKNPNLPHFRNGGEIGIGVTRGLQGVSVTTNRSDDQSVTGYSASGGSGSGTGGKASSKDIAQSIVDSLSIAGPGSPPTWARSISASDYLKGDPTATYKVGGAASLLRKGIDAIDLYRAATVQAIEAGPIGTTFSGASGLQKSLDAIALRLAVYTKNSIGQNARQAPFNLSADEQATLREGDLYGLKGKYDRNDPRLAKDRAVSFGFRDGGAYTVPGGGPVDSRMVGVMASPQERIEVKTRAQQEAERRAGGAPGGTTINVNISASDVDSFKRSEAQTVRAFVQKVNKALAGG